jgi:hypothetical protein
VPAGAGGLGQQRREPLHPLVDGDVVDFDPSFSQQLLNVAVRQAEAQVPAGREDDDVWWEAEAREGRPCSGSGTEATRFHTSSLAARTRDHRRRNSVHPSAADFYYGECEMRRHDPDTPMAERLVLWAYWLLSGYALRAWRALAALAMVVVLAGVMLAFWGFPDAALGFRPTAVDPGGALVYEQQPADPAAGHRAAARRPVQRPVSDRATARAGPAVDAAGGVDRDRPAVHRASVARVGDLVGAGTRTPLTFPPRFAT